jgi:hypothetical protein
LLSSQRSARSPSPPPNRAVAEGHGAAHRERNHRREQSRLDARKDSLLALNKIEFNKAFAFDRPTLLALEQGTVTVQPREFDKPATFKGPLLREVLGHIEAAKLKITVVAINGFSGWLSPEDIDRSDWILALEADGVPLGIGQQGPLWLINARAEGEKPGEDGRGRWVYAVFYMRVGE